MEKLTVNELFSGIGAQRKAFERLGIPHEVIGISEIDKYAIQSYEAIFGATRNYGDICTAPRLDYADLWTYSFPCQDISVAGNQKGISEGTRSGLLYQVQRLLEVAKDEGTLPKYLLLENVKNLVGKKFKSQFDDWLFYLDQLGYNTYWQVLNAKNYGIPQNRERVFALSIRKDLNEKYEFPKPEVLTKKLADVLEDEVDEKFYLKQSMVDYFIKNSLNNEEKGNGFRFKPHNPNSANIAFAVTTRAGGRMDDNFVLDENLSDKPFFQFDKEGIVKVIGASRGRNPENPSDQTVGAPTEQRLEINTQGTSNTITTVQKDNYVVEKIVCEQRCDEGLRFFKGDVVGALRTIDACGDKRVVENIIQVGNIVSTGNWDNPQRGRIYSTEGISPALNTVGGGGLEPKIIEGGIHKVDIPQTVRVRKFEVDNAKLVDLLRSHKNLTNKRIAESLNVPLTKVEHWFRTDDSFAIPDAEIWYQLKELLEIKTDEFDEAITTFEEKEGVYEKSNRCYFDTGIAPTLTSSSCDEKIINNFRIRKLTPLECWRLMGFDDEDFYKAQASGVSNSQLYKQAGNSIVVNVLEKIFKNLK